MCQARDCRFFAHGTDAFVGRDGNDEFLARCADVFSDLAAPHATLGENNI